MKFGGQTSIRPAELKSILKPSLSSVSIANVTTQVPVESTAYKYTLRRAQSKNRVVFQAEPEILNIQEQPTLTNDNLSSSKFIEPRAESTALDRQREVSKWHSTRLDYFTSTALNWSDASSPELSRSKQFSSTMINSTRRVSCAYEYQEESVVISRSPNLIERADQGDLSTICHEDTTCTSTEADESTYQSVRNISSYYLDSSESTENSSQFESSWDSSCSESTFQAAPQPLAANLDQNVYVCIVPTNATHQGDIALKFSERVKIIQMTNHSALVRVLHNGSVGYVPTDNLIPLARFLDSIQQLRK